MLARGTLKSAFFEFFLREVSTTPPPRAPHIPQRWRPKPQRTRTDCTAQAAGQAVPDARQTMPRHARTLDTLHRSALDTRQAAPGKSGRRRGWSVCNPSIMRIVIALSQAWYIDSILHKYHTNILLHLVIVNYYLFIDI